MLAAFLFVAFLFLSLAPAFVPLVGFVATVGLGVLGAVAGFFGTALLYFFRWGRRWPSVIVFFRAVLSDCLAVAMSLSLLAFPSAETAFGWPFLVIVDGRPIVLSSALLFADVACRFSVANIRFQCPGLFFGCSGVRFDRGSLSRLGGSFKFEF